MFGDTFINRMWVETITTWTPSWRYELYRALENLASSISFRPQAFRLINALHQFVSFTLVLTTFFIMTFRFNIFFVFHFFFSGLINNLITISGEKTKERN